MRRRYIYTLGAFAFPGGATGGNLGAGNARKKHFFAGLGNGNVDTQQGLRGAGNKRKRGERRGISRDELHAALVGNEAKDPTRHDFRAAAAGDRKMDAVDDVDLMDYLRKGADRRAALANQKDPIAPGDQADNQQPPSDGPWQLSVLMLLGIMGVLVGLFIHFSTDPAGQTHYFRRRKKKKPPFHSPSYKKKTDEWSEDEEVTEDDNYRGDTEGRVVGGSIAKKRSPVPKTPDDPTAGLYYQLNTADSFRQQEHRLRKSATQQTSNDMNDGTGSARGRAETTIPAFNSPCRQRRQSPRSGNSARKSRTAGSSPFPSPPFHLESDLGSGLEGFGHTETSHDADAMSDAPAKKAQPLVKKIGTFTPTESFASMSAASGNQSSALNTSKHTVKIVGGVDFDTHPISSGEKAEKKTFVPASSPKQSGGYPRQSLAELPTPRVDHTRGKRDMAQMIKAPSKEIGDLPLSLSSTDRDHSSAISESNSILEAKVDAIGAIPGLPLVPDLNVGSELGDDSNNNFHIDAPRSVLLEELQLVRMESGVSGPKWRTKTELSVSSIDKIRQENEEKLREASAAIDPADDPRNSIQHIRSDLTISSDASSSLSSKITFSELKLEDVIGGGGFGQVWRATWKGTPGKTHTSFIELNFNSLLVRFVSSCRLLTLGMTFEVAVKVLTGSAQAETVPKAVLEEFIAEINMVSGMRHPNICLFMGACLDPPNRAIVTELCVNGSLWDALRSSLTSYEVADGRTRSAWPLNLYEPIIAPPPTYKGGRPFPDEGHFSHTIEPPLAPGGAWPWVLVKRVAEGTARGMCYLHSGNPPVLHRDLKSANILLDESYTAKLADFGLSRLKAVRSSGMTGNCGTVQWMAPEVLCNENYAEPADVFSYGIILWEMLSKECPYDGMTPIQCALSVLNQNKRPNIPEWCPQPFRALIRNCVERDPQSRPTFAQILSALDTMPYSAPS
ncbi:hypothetical protein ACHAWF_005353 [Thalassiosira exigua]